ncbi:hypothetical protein WDJ50_02410 [Deinococcus sp. VB142]|uniref:LEM domain-containing protein n=1 Tax=Deinococcus sp. VB142 TaxID=3112952 RepID=A0AAU6Q3Q9_9DEIO
MSDLSPKEQRQQLCDKHGIKYAKKDPIRVLDEKLAKAGIPIPAKTSTRNPSRTRAGSAVGRSGGSSSGSSRQRSAPLSAASAPTTRMRVDDYDQQPARQPGSADILAVALVVFMCVLAACNTQLTGKGGPRSHVPAPVIVAHA